MARKQIRLYADTSVFGGVFDEEFQEPSRRFFEQVQRGRFLLVLSGIVHQELEGAPDEVKAVYDDVVPSAETIDVDGRVLQLRNAYLEARVVSQQYSDDALHVALATVSGCAAIVSWNFRHIVHFQKIPMYNAISEVNGYPAIAIYSPLEVIEHENEDL